MLLLFAVCVSVYSVESRAQSRKYMAQFDHFKSYYNPALTGLSGSAVGSFMRNQWAGFDGAPVSIFLNGEFDLGDYTSEEGFGKLGKNALGMSLYYDQFGAFQDTRIILSYASRVSLTDKVGLRLGLGVNYALSNIDGSKIVADQVNDPIINQYFGSYADMRVLDFNAGLVLTHPNYFIGYSAHNISQGKYFISGDAFMDEFPVEHIIQAGFKNRVGENVAISTTLMANSYRYSPLNLQINFKTLLYEWVWIGGGHRLNYAHNFQLGFLFSYFTFAYIYELPMTNAYLLPNTSHEFVLSIGLTDLWEDKYLIFW
jgi:type IX secretion system PorP/SprF family membrane protein